MMELRGARLRSFKGRLLGTTFAGMITLTSHSDAQVVIPSKHTTEGHLFEYLQKGWKIVNILKDGHGNKVLMLHGAWCKPGPVAYCETGQKAYADSPPEHQRIQCFVPLQFDSCGIGPSF